MRAGYLSLTTIALVLLLGACSNARTTASKMPSESAAPAAPSSSSAAPNLAHAAPAASPTAAPASTSKSPTTTAAPAAAAASASGSASDRAKVDAAVVAAESWLALVDSAKYDESWRAAATLFQRGVSEDQWPAMAAKALAPLGKLRSRHLHSAAYQTSLPGAPDGKYVVIRFDATFENKAQAVETITPSQGEDGTWKVAGYFVK